MTDLYLTQNGTLERSDNTLLFSNETTQRRVPIKDVSSIYAIGEITVNSKLLQILTQNGIPLHFFNYSGFYIGTYAPRQEHVSGRLLVEQVSHYIDGQKRLAIAKEILEGAIHNMRKTLMQYELSDAEIFKEKMGSIDAVRSIPDLLLFEAEVRKTYYHQFNEITNDKEFEFVKRTKQPPDNYINTLISFGNSMLYTTMLAEIFKTPLDPKVSYLHEPFERRYSLNLDLSEIFKPLIVDRVIFTLINKKIIRPEHFDKEINFCYLTAEGRKLFIREYDSKLKTSLRYPKLNRNVSYRYILRLECHKLIKHLLEGQAYKSFKIYW